MLWNGCNWSSPAAPSQQFSYMRFEKEQNWVAEPMTGQAHSFAGQLLKVSDSTEWEEYSSAATIIAWFLLGTAAWKLGHVLTVLYKLSSVHNVLNDIFNLPLMNHTDQRLVKMTYYSFIQVGTNYMRHTSIIIHIEALKWRNIRCWDRITVEEIGRQPLWNNLIF